MSGRKIRVELAKGLTGEVVARDQAAGGLGLVLWLTADGIVRLESRGPEDGTPIGDLEGWSLTVPLSDREPAGLAEWLERDAEAQALLRELVALVEDGEVPPGGGTDSLLRRAWDLVDWSCPVPHVEMGVPGELAEELSCEELLAMGEPDEAEARRLAEDWAFDGRNQRLAGGVIIYVPLEDTTRAILDRWRDCWRWKDRRVGEGRCEE